MSKFKIMVLTSLFALCLMSSFELDYNKGHRNYYNYSMYFCPPDLTKFYKHYSLSREEISLAWKFQSKSRLNSIFSTLDKGLTFQAFYDLGECLDSTRGYPYDDVLISKKNIACYFLKSEAYFSRLIHAVFKMRVDPITGNRYLGEYILGVFESDRFFADLSLGSYAREDEEKRFISGIKLGLLFDNIDVQTELGLRKRSAILVKTTFTPIIGASFEFGQDLVYENDYFSDTPTIGIFYENSFFGTALKYGIFDANEKFSAGIKIVPFARIKFTMDYVYQKYYSYNSFYFMVDEEGEESILTFGVSLLFW